MVCLYCHGETAVKNSRLQKRQNRTWRRRQCQACNATLTTIETYDFATALVVKRPDGTSAPFNRDKLFVSILTSLGHRNNAMIEARHLTDTVMTRILKTSQKATVQTTDLIANTQKVLGAFDIAASTHYSAYHRI